MVYSPIFLYISQLPSDFSTGIHWDPRDPRDPNVGKSQLFIFARSGAVDHRVFFWAALGFMVEMYPLAI